MGTSEEYRVLAFISAEKQNTQKEQIQEYCKGEKYYVPKDNDFFSDWDMLVEELKNKDIVVVTDVKDVVPISVEACPSSAGFNGYPCSAY